MMSSDALRSSRVLVTGASGFLGSHLCEALIGRGAEVYAVSRSEPAAGDQPVRWLHSAFDAEDEIERVLRTARPDLVYHLAGHVTAAPDVSHVLPTFTSLLASTVYLLLRATEIGCRRIVLAGSWIEPTGPGGVPLSPYAAAKAGASLYARMFHALYAAPVVVVRPSVTYGPRQSPSKVISYVVSSLLRGQAPRLGSGELVADWIYVDDVADGLLAAATAPAAAGAEIDLATGTLTALRDVVERIVAIVRPSVAPQFGAHADRPSGPTRSADVERAWTLLGWRAKTALNTGLERTIAWHRRQLALARPETP